MKNKIFKGSYKNRILLLFLLTALLLMPSGCRKTAEVTDDEGYDLYYISDGTTKLVTKRYTPENINGEAEQSVKEVVEELGKNYDGYKSVIGQNVKVLKCTLTTGNLDISFDGGYLEMNVTDEVLLRTAFVLSLTQIEGVDMVTFYVNDQPLTDSTGAVIGAMKASDFIDISGEEINNYSAASFNLYFSNADGSKLKAYNIECAYSNNVSLERFIIDKLIEGPDSDEYRRTLPSGTKVNSVTTKDNICYVDFTESFLAKSAVSDKMVIYSVVNSLSELPYIYKVQISINGDTTVKYNTVSLNGTFSRNLDIIETQTEQITTEAVN